MRFFRSASTALTTSFSLFCLSSILIAACGTSAPTPSRGKVDTVVAVTFAAMTAPSPTFVREGFQYQQRHSFR